MFKFELGEQVKVQVLNIITKGEIVSRNSVETKHITSRSYSVKVDLGIYEDTMSPDEDFLVEVQQLPLGIITK